jgi:plasmid stabilization system protein ParE
MVMKVVVSQFAEEQLNGIFSYYSVVAGHRVAHKIIDNILSVVEIIGRNSLIGAVEELLKEYPEEYCYLVNGNYKIIYRVAEESIIVESVFDCRQNPIKIKEFK